MTPWLRRGRLAGCPRTTHCSVRYANHDEDGVDQKGVKHFIHGVFGKAESTGLAKKAKDELHALLRAEGGAIPKHDWEVFVAKPASALGPLVHMHKVRAGRVLLVIAAATTWLVGLLSSIPS